MSPEPDTASQWRPVRFRPTRASREQWDAYHLFRRARHAESSPDEPLASDEVVEAQMKVKSPNWNRDRYIVEADGRIVAQVDLSSPKPGTPEYPSNKHLVSGSPGVITPYRRRGLGAALLHLAVEELDTRGARVLSGWVCEHDGHEFAARVGAGAKQVERISKLEWAEIDWAMVDQWATELATRSPGTKLELYPCRLPDEFLDEYCPVLSALMNLMPWDDADHGDIVITPDDRRADYKRLDAAGAEHHTLLAREPDGRITGVTDVAWYPEHPDEIEQWFTGVHPDARGRGLGKALKAEKLRMLDERYEGLARMRTGNSTTNAAMLAINERLGFREYRCYTTYQIERDALAAWLDGLVG